MSPRLASVLTPMSTENMELAAQCGVSDIVGHYLGEDIGPLRKLHERLRAHGLRLSVVEGYLPIERIKLGCDDGSELRLLKQLIRQMGELDIPILCYNFMAGTDWVRTRLDVPARGGARVTAFDQREAEQAVLLGHDGAGTRVAPDTKSLDAATLWNLLEALLNELLPVAEDAGVLLAMHPDDPPLDSFLGNARIMNCVEGFDRLHQIAPSPHNAICFCQGTFTEMGVDIPAAISHFGSRIAYVHFRDVRGEASSFTETFHDDGPTDMFAAMQAYHAIGFRGPIRPDHVPQLSGEQDGEPGYTMKGRLFAFGYMRGLMQAAAAVAGDR